MAVVAGVMVAMGVWQNADAHGDGSGDGLLIFGVIFAIIALMFLLLGVWRLARQISEIYVAVTKPIQPPSAPSSVIS